MTTAPTGAPPTDGTAHAERRAVILVGNPMAPYSRALRLGRVLVDEGFIVEIAATEAPGLPTVTHEGPITIHRYGPPVPSGAMGVQGVDSRRHRLRRRLSAIRLGVSWPSRAVRAWWSTVERELAPADLYHACGARTLEVALRLRDRQPSARPARVIYDVIDDYFRSSAVTEMPRPIRWWQGRREAGLARDADAIITANQGMAASVAVRWGLPAPLLAVDNYPDVPVRAERSELIREATGLPPSTRVVVYQGRLSPDFGIEEAGEAVLLVPEAALVLIGFGSWFDRMRDRDRDPRFAGRHFTLEARHPDELLAWTASADVSLVVRPPVIENVRLYTPNKFWEAFMAGTPVVIAPGSPVMTAILARERLGAVARSLAPADFAAAIRSVLDRPASERAAERHRIAARAREAYSWPVAAAGYRALLRRLVS